MQDIDCEKVTQTLTREERLQGKRNFEYLFANGKSFFQGAYKIVWTTISQRESPVPVRFAVSVAKKRFNRAVKRNLLKRRTREAFRKNKHIIHKVLRENQQIWMIAIYSSDTVMKYAELDDAMKTALNQIVTNYEKST
jgi:ribonuclease P protein component